MYKGLNLDENTQKYFGMCTNIDDNVGTLMNRLTHWGIEKNTILIFMTDNGGTGGVRVFNDGMRGAKGTPYRGGTRVPAFFRWPGTLQPGERKTLAAHIDLFPTLAELAGTPVPPTVRPDGRSLVPLLKDVNVSWPDRYLFTHVGRWEVGKAAESKYDRCRIRNAQFSLVNSKREKSWELYDLAADPGEKKNLAAERLDVVTRMEAVYDRWWGEVLPLLENENVDAPALAPYKNLYFQQYGGGPGADPRYTRPTK
jgi:arylsulfatase